MGRPLRRREARLPQGGQVLLLPRLVGRQRHGALVHRAKALGRPAKALQVRHHRRRRRRPYVAAYALRSRQPAGHEAVGGARDRLLDPVERDPRPRQGAQAPGFWPDAEVLEAGRAARDDAVSQL